MLKKLRSRSSSSSVNSTDGIPPSQMSFTEMQQTERNKRGLSHSQSFSTTGRSSRSSSSSSKRLSLAEEWDRDIVVTAKWPFVGQQPGELTFKRGEQITVLTRTADQFDWWEGRCGDSVGIFPANYCMILN